MAKCDSRSSKALLGTWKHLNVLKVSCIGGHLKGQYFITHKPIIISWEVHIEQFPSLKFAGSSFSAKCSHVSCKTLESLSQYVRLQSTFLTFINGGYRQGRQTSAEHEQFKLYVSACLTLLSCILSFFTF